MNKKQTRQQELLQIIKSYGILSAKQFASMLGVSEMTVRRDLIDLEAAEKGAVFSKGVSGPSVLLEDTDYNLLQAFKQSNAQKSRIGEFAASLIEQDDTIIIDTGSTTARMLPHIPQDKFLTVLCYNANVLLELKHKHGVKILCGGGMYHPNTEMLESPESIQLIERVRAHKIFLAAAGIHDKLGITCENEYEVATKQAAINSSAQHILLADSSKFGQIRSAYFCELTSIHIVVTDSDLPLYWQTFLKDSGVELYLV